MAKELNKIIVLLCLILCFASPAYADSYSVWNECVSEEVSLDVAPAAAFAIASDEGATATPYTVSYTVYDDGMISSTYVDYARGLLQFVKPFDDYVFARTGQYEYIFAHGDWDDDFSGEATVYQITTSNYNNSYSYDSFTDSNFNLSVGDGLVYSSIAPYPSLTGADYTHGILLLSAFALCMIFIGWIAKHAFMSFGWL